MDIGMDEKVLEVYDSAFPQDFIETFLQYNSAPMWEMREDYFYNDLNDIDFFSKMCLNKINEITKTEHDLIRCYRHALSSFSLGQPHFDTHNPANRTFLVYMHPEWNILWGGQLRVGDNLETQVDPMPNRAVYFSAEHHQHYVSPHNSNKFRITYVWKLKTV
jgi:Rps23 Pro-64 3,4-dihydroxylase Tpa1-like proline 4-hydroxylase